ncbi:MAG TPA: hypothetical protein PLQ00_02560, partial [Thermoguttaceae bacterium]|nr:hypothetical protein [Thermoguttaceae bacterium]
MRPTAIRTEGRKWFTKSRTGPRGAAGSQSGPAASLPKGRNARRRRGAILVLATMLMVVLVGMVAFGVDLGY